MTDETISEGELPESVRKKLAPDLENLKKLNAAIGPYKQGLTNQGLDISFTLPGHPANGNDGFYQSRDGLPMVRLEKKGRIAFLWFNSDGSWTVRRWMKVSDHKDSEIVNCETLFEALGQIAPNGRTQF